MLTSLGGEKDRRKVLVKGTEYGMSWLLDVSWNFYYRYSAVSGEDLFLAFYTLCWSFLWEGPLCQPLGA